MRWIVPSLLVAGLFLSACENEKKPLEGLRVSVVDFDEYTHVDPEVKDHNVTLPPATEQTQWSQTGGNASHALQNPALGESLTKSWSVSIGAGVSSTIRYMNTPVVSAGVVYALNNEQDVIALSLETGAEMWRTNVAPEDESTLLYGGGLAVDGEIVIVGSPLAEVLALDVKTGEILWRHKTASPVRAAPTVSEGMAFVLTLNNQLYAYDTKTGALRWSHAGIIEHAGLLGMASPVVSEGVVVVAYSSGEVQALKAENGYDLWTAHLSAIRRPDSLAHMTHIKAQPVIHEGRVFVLGYNQRFACFDLATGARVWERHIGGVSMPAVVGDYVFLVSNQSELICLKAATGQIIWASPLPKDQDAPRKIIWTGPLVAGNTVYVFGRDARLLSFSPESGQERRHMEIPSLSSVPVVANQKMVMMTNSGQVVVYR